MKTVQVMCLVLAILASFSAAAQRTLGDGIKDLATQISTSAAKEQKQKIAVVSLRELDGEATVLGTYLAEELVTHLFQIGNFEIVERQMLDKVLAELKIQQSGGIDPSSAKQIGRITGVDAIVTGTITDLQSFVGVNCRLIDAATGKIFAAAQTKITKDDDVKKIMSVPMRSAKPRSDRPPPKRDGALTWTGPDVRVTVDKAVRQGDTLTLTLGFELISSNSGNYSACSPYLLDENGERWAGRFEEGDCSYIHLLPQARVRRRASFRAPQTSDAGSTFTLVVEQWRLTLRGIVPEQ